MRKLLRLVVLAVVAAVVPAQETPVVVANLSPYENRGGWVTFAVPDPGEGTPSVSFVDPQGWPAFWGQKRPGTRLVHVRHGTMDPFEHTYGILRAAADEYSVAQPETVDPPFRVLIGAHEWNLNSFDVVEQNSARTVFRFRDRIPGTMMLGVAWFYVYRNWKVVPFELALFCSDPSQPQSRQDLGQIRLDFADGMFPVVDFGVSRGGEEHARRVGDRWHLKLHDATWIGDGQGLGWSGRLLMHDGATEDDWFTFRAVSAAPVTGMALNWKEKWGPWGVVPRASGFDAVSTYLRFVQATYERGTIFQPKARFYGLNNVPSGTGAQQDFGVTKLGPALSPMLGNPSHLHELVPSILYEVCRGQWFHEEDGRPLVLSEHPQWTTWGFTTHWNSGVSKDRLGKAPISRPPWHEVNPKDFAHASSNNLAGWTILTGSRLGQYLCRMEITAASAFWSLGEIRAWGRVPLVVTWNYLATGDERARTIFASKLYAHGLWDSIIERSTTHEVVPLGFSLRLDRRHLKGHWPFWLPWQEGLAISGLDAMLQVSPDSKMEKVLTILCDTLVEHGWWKWKGRWTVGSAIHYREDGTALEEWRYQQWSGPNDPTPTNKPEVAPHWPGTAFDWWASAGTRIGVRRCSTPELRERARVIFESLRVTELRHAEWSSVK